MDRITKDYETLLTLVRLGIGHETKLIPKAIDWVAVKSLADKHGLSAIVMDGASVLNEQGLLEGARSMDSMLKKVWIAEVIQNYENRYADYRKHIGQLAQFYNLHGFKMMVLKGYGLSLNYPTSSHRPIGDIDIWNFGRYKEADEAVHKELGLDINCSQHHHTVFTFKGYSVENHYDWINVHSHKSNAEMEKIFKQLAMDDSYYTEIDGERVYLPSPNLHALYIIKHLSGHFASEEINLRQVLDWAFFVDKNSDSIDWSWLDEMLQQFGLRDFFTFLNYICVFHFGLKASKFPPILVKACEGAKNCSLPERVFNDILTPEFSGEMPNNFFKRIVFKYRRWKANEWKNKLCYPDSQTGTFIRQVWAHLLKPSSI